MTETPRKDWLARRVQRHMPTRDQMAENRFLRPIAHRFLSPELWRFTRRSVPRGVALGLFAAFIVPIGQIFLAAFLALPARANVPLAAIVTFVTNPFTLPFWLVIANRTGALVLNFDAAVGGRAGELANDQGALARWLEVGGVTAFGFVVLALVSAAIGYLIASFVWKRIVWAKRRRRLIELERRLDRRLKEGEG